MAKTRDLRVGPGKTGLLIARGQGRCKDCKLLDNSSREDFPNGMIRQGRCVAHPIQPNGKWDADWCDLWQWAIKPELNDAGEPVYAFVFAAKDGK